MDLDTLKQILELVREHELSEFEVEQDGLRLKIRKDRVGAHVDAFPPASVQSAARGLQNPMSGSPPLLPGTPLPDDTEIELAVVKSPLVGTFYQASEPGATAFAEVGTVVKKGQVLCIIEAMKLMNEIESEYDGEIVSVYTENGQPVQYGERLFAIRTT
jgi:acetyl-CoA carboxylase biotin carboxyl carrier protein